MGAANDFGHDGRSLSLPGVDHLDVEHTVDQGGPGSHVPTTGEELRVGHDHRQSFGFVDSSLGLDTHMCLGEAWQANPEGQGISDAPQTPRDLWCRLCGCRPCSDLSDIEEVPEAPGAFQRGDIY